MAQNKTSLCVWYNIDIPEKVTMFPLKVREGIRREGEEEEEGRGGEGGCLECRELSFPPGRGDELDSTKWPY